MNNHFKNQYATIDYDQPKNTLMLTNRKLDTTQIKTAVVMPENTFMKVSVNKITSELETQAADQNYQLFKSPEQALSWLDQ